MGKPLWAACRDRVQIRQQLVTQLEPAPADRFVGFAESPRFLPGRAQATVIAEKRHERTGPCPADQQLAAAILPKASDVCPAHGHAAHPQVQARAHAQPRVLPAGALVAGPDHSVTLHSGIP